MSSYIQHCSCRMADENYHYHDEEENVNNIAWNNDYEAGLQERNRIIQRYYT